MRTATAVAEPASDLEGGRRSPSKAWLLFLPILFTVLEWRVQGSDRAPEGSVNVGKGVLLAVVIGLCAFLLGRVDRFRLTRAGRYYFAYCGLALVSAQITGAWQAPTMRIIRLAMTVLAVLLVSEVVVRSGGTVIEAFLKALVTVLGMFLLEAVLFPSLAWQPPAFGSSVRRLQGVLPGVDPNAIGALSGIVVVIALVCAALNWRRRLWLPAAALGSVSLLLSRTRIPAAGALIALLVALFAIRRVVRSRRMLAAILAVCLVMGMIASAPIAAWVKRDQQAELLFTVSGRASSWESVISQDRTAQETLFGIGLGAKDVLVGTPTPILRPIDSSWLATYWETGLLGVLILAMMVIGGLAGSVRASRFDPEQGLAVGLYVFLLLWSIAETGFDDASIAVITILVASTLARPLLAAETIRTSNGAASRPDGGLTGPPRAAVS